MNDLYYQITQSVLIIIMSTIAAFVAINQNWFGKEGIFTMLFSGITIIIIGLFSCYFSAGIDEVISIFFLKKFSMNGRLVMIGYSGILTSFWLALYNSLRKKIHDDKNG